MILALIGSHGAGKTTLGHALSARLGWPFHDEIGARLAADTRLRPSGVIAADQQEAFDEAVLLEELARDASWDPCTPRLVETWHPGNLAYTAVRSPNVAERHFDRIAKSTPVHLAAVIEVMAPLDVLARRKREEGSVAFFASVGSAARGFAQRLGLRLLASVSTHKRSSLELAAQLAPLVLAAASARGAR